MEGRGGGGMVTVVCKMTAFTGSPSHLARAAGGGREDLRTRTVRSEDG